MEVNSDQKHSLKYLLLCSLEEINSYRFGTTWGSVNHDNFHFCVKYRFKKGYSKHLEQKCQKVCCDWRHAKKPMVERWCQVILFRSKVWNPLSNLSSCLALLWSCLQMPFSPHRKQEGLVALNSHLTLPTSHLRLAQLSFWGLCCPSL